MENEIFEGLGAGLLLGAAAYFVVRCLLDRLLSRSIRTSGR